MLCLMDSSNGMTGALVASATRGRLIYWLGWLDLGINNRPGTRVGREAGETDTQACGGRQKKQRTRPSNRSRQQRRRPCECVCVRANSGLWGAPR